MPAVAQDDGHHAADQALPQFFFWHDTRLKFEKLLGSGSYAYVCQVVEPASNMRFAMKFAKTDKPEGSNVSDIMEEYCCLRQFSHPNILPTYGIVATSTQQDAGMLVALADSSLSFFLGANKYAETVRERAGLGLQLCFAVSYVHKKGRVHLDLKPGNALVTPPLDSHDCCLQMSASP